LHEIPARNYWKLTAYSLFKTCHRMMETEENCPMCTEKIIKENIQKVADAERYLNPDEGKE